MRTRTALLASLAAIGGCSDLSNFFDKTVRSLQGLSSSFGAAPQVARVVGNAISGRQDNDKYWLPIFAADGKVCEDILGGMIL